MSIPGKRLRLRAIERSDIPTFVRWFNDPEVRKYLQIYMPMSYAQEERWFEAHLQDQRNCIFGIETLDGKLIGNIGLHDIMWKDSRAMLGILIGEKEYWDQGYGTEAITTLLRFAFTQKNLHRLYLMVYEYNQRAIRCYEKCGFKHEGRMRQAHFYDGKYYDELIMGILRDEFLASQQ
nr:GNAT family N-acetyltransferase [Chloroflexota bacterium]